MSKRGDREFVFDAKEAIERVHAYVGEMDYKAFLKDGKTQDAVVRNLEIIGEAVKNLSKDLKRKYSDIRWRDIAGMRDKITHFYFGIKWDILWSVIKDKLPELREEIDQIIQREFS